MVSISAVGSLVQECPPGDLVIPSQYVDRTKGVRAHSFLGDGLVGHVSLTHPVNEKLCAYVHERKSKFNFKIHAKKPTFVSKDLIFPPTLNLSPAVNSVEILSA